MLLKSYAVHHGEVTFPRQSSMSLKSECCSIWEGMQLILLDGTPSNTFILPTATPLSLALFPRLPSPQEGESWYTVCACAKYSVKFTFLSVCHSLGGKDLGTRLHYHLHPFHFVLFKFKDLVAKQHPIMY